MTGDASPAVWRATGLAWSTGAAALEWSTPGDGAPKTSPLDLGAAAERAAALLATAESAKSLSWPEGQTRTDS
ncbi:hypothetical protein OG500_29070 [Kitasatospora sp. NBC_01250]|uniref:hypothetical protein n=1 Tax=Kitasatospora sp. NBC_01250 TaxID=2903571 RepID=UPI002E32A14B|nr:hypothetical protein [Kitasatospora sp. NBC_01250]